MCTWCSCWLEAVRSIEDRQEGLVVHFSRRRIDDICNLGLGWILAQCAEEIAQGFPGDSTRAFLIEEGKRLLVFCIEAVSILADQAGRMWAGIPELSLCIVPVAELQDATLGGT